MKRLIIAPHADDEVMGCGGLLAKYPDECVVAVVTTPTDERLAEFEKAMAILGIEHRYLLLVPDGSVPLMMRAVVQALDELLAYEKPDEVYLPFPSMHQDHVGTYEAGMRACRLSMTEGHWFPPKVLVYDVAAYDVNLYPTDLRWNVFEPLTFEQAALKSDAVKAYASEMVDGAHPVNGVIEAAHAIGQPRRLQFAEQYALVRDVR